MSNFYDPEKHARAEILLGLSYLEIDPNDQSQKDRVAWWAMEIGEQELAREHATSEKMLALYKAKYGE